MRRSSPSDRGASLISVLVIVMIMSLAALAATDALAKTIGTAKASGHRADTFWTARGTAYATETYLSDILGKTGRTLTADSEVWDQDVLLPVKRGIVSVRLRERTNCFNLSGLVESEDGGSLREDRISAFRELLAASGLNETEALILAGNLADWIRSGRPEMNRIEAVDQLAGVEGYSPEVLSQIERLVCVLQDEMQPALNLNTMEMWQAPLLVSLFSPELSASEAQYLIEDRPRTGWPDLSLIWELDSVKRIAPDARRDNAVSLESTFFEADISVQNGGGRAAYTALYGPGNETDSVFLSLVRKEF